MGGPPFVELVPVEVKQRPTRRNAFSHVSRLPPPALNLRNSNSLRLGEAFHVPSSSSGPLPLLLPLQDHRDRPVHTIAMRLRRPSPSLRAARILLALSLLSLLVPVSLADASAGDSTDSLTTSQLLSKANALLATGQTASALSLYDEALSRDPSDYLTLYRKGATHLALGHLSAAADAFERVLGLSEYEKARLQLAKIALRNGEYDKGDVHVGKYLGKSKDVEGEEVRTQLKEARSSGAAARKAEKAKRWEDCVNEATKALVVSAHSSELRLLRADCSIAAGDLEGATGDLTCAVTYSLPQLSLR